MRALLLAAVPLLCWALPSHAQVPRDALIESCISSNPSETLDCGLYVMGFMDALDSSAIAFHFLQGFDAPEFNTQALGICIPANVSYDDISLVLRNHIRVMFNDLPPTAAALMFDALLTRYPCNRIVE